MSCDCAGLPTSFDRFREVWHVDFEFRFDVNHLPVPVAMFAKEHRTGAEISMRRDQLLARSRAPFDTGPDALVVAYSAVAELSCFHVLQWPAPGNVLCAYVEASAAINGRDIVGLASAASSCGPRAPHSGTLPDSYETDALPIVNQQLSRAGLSLAMVMNTCLR
jgi:hypothetical protein